MEEGFTMEPFKQQRKIFFFFKIIYLLQYWRFLQMPYTRPDWVCRWTITPGFPPTLIRIVQWVLNVQGWWSLLNTGPPFNVLSEGHVFLRSNGLYFIKNDFTASTYILGLYWLCLSISNFIKLLFFFSERRISHINVNSIFINHIRIWF